MKPVKLKRDAPTHLFVDCPELPEITPDTKETLKRLINLYKEYKICSQTVKDWKTWYEADRAR